MPALSKLEYTGVQIITSLKAILSQLRAHIGVSEYYRDFKRVIIEWNSGRSHIPPTWKSLLSVLKDLNLEELSQQIEDYLIYGELLLYLPLYKVLCC